MDRIIRCITADGALMASAIDSSDTVYTAQSLHGLSATASAALGRLLTGASMMGAMLKQEHASLTLRVDGGGPLGVLTAISDSRGNVRGCVDNPEAEVPKKPNGKLDVGAAVGQDGRLGVIRSYGTGEPYHEAVLYLMKISSNFVSFICDLKSSSFYLLTARLLVCNLIFIKSQSFIPLLFNYFLAKAPIGSHGASTFGSAS